VCIKLLRSPWCNTSANNNENFHHIQMTPKRNQDDSILSIIQKFTLKQEGNYNNNYNNNNVHLFYFIFLLTSSFCVKYFNYYFHLTAFLPDKLGSVGSPSPTIWLVELVFHMPDVPPATQTSPPKHSRKQSTNSNQWPDFILSPSTIRLLTPDKRVLLP